MTDSLYRPRDHAGVEEWRTLCADLKRCYNLCAAMEHAWALDGHILGILYHLLQSIKSRWATYRSESLMRFIQKLNVSEEEREHHWQQEYQRSQMTEEEEQFKTVIAQVRQLWVSV